jgi:UDP-glucose 4-epimerase
LRALVTGGAGFIGSTLVDRLLAEGHEVDVVDDLSTGSEANLAAAREAGGRRLTVHQVDIRSPEVVDHVARPVYDAEVNVVGTVHVLEGARAAGSRKVVYAASGGTLYGDPDPSRLPLDEANGRAPLSPYGITKAVALDYLAAYQVLHGLDWAAMALANIYGPRQDPHGEAGVVAIFARRLLAGERCRLFDEGRNTRDYTYVDDVVDAFVRAAAAGDGVCNIGTGVETTTADLYAVVAEAVGSPDAEPELAPPRPGDLARSALNPGRARTELGWEPQVSLRDGVARAVDWFRARA